MRRVARLDRAIATNTPRLTGDPDALRQLQDPRPGADYEPEGVGTTTTGQGECCTHC